MNRSASTLIYASRPRAQAIVCAVACAALAAHGCRTRAFNAAAKSERPSGEGCAAPERAPARELSFDGPNDDALRVLVIGDPGSGGAHQRIVSDAMFSVCSKMKCQMALGLGDMFYENGLDTKDRAAFEAQFAGQFTRFFERFRSPALNPDFRVFTVLGNHDYGNPTKAGEPFRALRESERAEARARLEGKAAEARLASECKPSVLSQGDWETLANTKRVFGQWEGPRYVPQGWRPVDARRYLDNHERSWTRKDGKPLSEAWTLPDFEYTVAARYRGGEVRFLAFDSMKAIVRDAQTRSFLAQEGARAKEGPGTWVIPYAHHPLFSAGEHGLDFGIEDLRTRTLDVLCGISDLYVSGHEHEQQFGRYDANGCSFSQLISGTGGKHELRDLPPERKAKLASANAGFSNAFHSHAPGFAVLEFRGQALDVHLYEIDFAAGVEGKLDALQDEAFKVDRARSKANAFHWVDRHDAELAAIGYDVAHPDRTATVREARVFRLEKNAAGWAQPGSR